MFLHKGCHALLKKCASAYYIKKDQLRVYKRKPFPTTFVNIHNYIKDLVTSNWERDIPVSRDSLRNILLIHVSSKKKNDNEYFDFSNTYINRNDSGKSLNTFITRSLDYCGFKARKSSVCRKLPHQWKLLALKVLEGSEESSVRLM